MGTSISVALHTDTESPEVVNQVLADAYRSVITSARATYTPGRAGVDVTVTDSGGTVFGPEDVGLNSTPDLADVEERFG